MLSSASKLKIGIVVVTYSMIPRELIESLTSKHDIKYYIFHHGSDDVKQGVEELFLEYDSELFLNCGNRGLAKSWNQGIYLSTKDKNDVTLVINDDIIFHPQSFDLWINFILETRESGLVFCHGEEDQADGSVISRAQDFACFAFGKDAYTRVGKFDENYVPAYFEDFDYIVRCDLAGVKFATDPAIRCKHDRSHTIRACPELAATVSEFWSCNQNRFIEKWGWHEPNREKTFPYPYNNSKNSLCIPFPE